MRIVAIILGIVVAAIGGAMAYHAWFVAPRTTVLITSSGTVRELPNYARIVGGIVMLVAGAGLAFLAAARRRLVRSDRQRRW